MTEINENEILPLLGIAKAGYTEIIQREDPESEKAEMARDVEGAIKQAMDIIHDYNLSAKVLAQMQRKYCQANKPIRKNGVWCCPDCGRRVAFNHTHCHWCGKKMGWR